MASDAEFTITHLYMVDLSSSLNANGPGQTAPPPAYYLQSALPARLHRAETLISVLRAGLVPVTELIKAFAHMFRPAVAAHFIKETE